MMRISYLAGVLFLSAICGCQKKEDPKAEQPTATINITSPQAGQEVKAGTELAIQAQIKGDVTLHGYDVFIVDKQSMDTVFKTDSHTHAKELQVNEVWTNTLSKTTDLEVYIKTEINHEGASVTNSVAIQSKL